MPAFTVPDVIVKLTDDDIKNKNDVQLKRAIEVLQSMERGSSVASFVRRF